MPASVRVRDLARRYGPVEALRGVSFDVQEGEIFGLLGPNGAGKTTALECLLGLRRPDRGSVEIGGYDALADPRQARLHVGAQLQGATLQDKITPRRALELFAAFYTFPAGISELLSQFGLLEKKDAAFVTLSAGQRQRLFLALAFVNNPSVVVLDEPTAGLDPRSRHELHDLIAASRAAGRSVLLSTHDIDEAEGLCDRVGILDNGRLVAVGTPSELIAAASAHARVEFRTEMPVAVSALSALRGVAACEARGSTWVLRSTHLGETLVNVISYLDSSGNGLIDLQVHRPTLEDAFLSLTGRPWSPRSEAAN